MNHPIEQVAYFVPDAEAAARAHAAQFGSGPYYLAKHIPLRRCLYRGQEAVLDHTSAYGQWGQVMIEFVQQHNDGASVFRDLYPDGGSGLHHVALIVPDLRAALSAFAAKGFETALYAELASGTAFAMADATRVYGHFIEMYEPTEGLLGLYRLVREAHESFDGRELIRPLDLGQPGFRQ